MSGRTAQVADELARQSFADGRNCAESVISAVQQAVGLEMDGAGAGALGDAAGSAWQVGIHGEGCLCGALAGAVMLAGVGAPKGGSARDRQRSSGELALAIKHEFQERWGSSCCRTVRRGMDPSSPECLRHCEEVTALTARIATERLVEARNGAGRARAWAGLARGAKRALLPPALGLLLGFEAAWLAGRSSWLDMRVDTSIAVPAGLMAGGLWALWAGPWSRRAARPRTLAGRALAALALVGLVPVVLWLALVPYAQDTAAIIVLGGLGLRGTVGVATAKLAAASALGLGLAFSAARVARGPRV